jgi:hypothetical protein|nr:phage tail tube protein [uncultured Ralstonia sp.]
MAQRIAGICFVKVDGAQFEISGDIEIPLTEFKREAVMGLSGPAGYKETALEPYIKVIALFTPDFPINSLRTNTTLTVTAELANGVVYTLSNAFVRGEPKAKPIEGTIEIEFSGSQGQWSNNQ